jgi:uncharacterized iron-regulated membrane protein
VLVSLSGSILVFRREVYTYFRPGATVVPRGDRLSQEAIADSAKRVYPSFTVGRVQIRRRQPTLAADVWLTNGTTTLHRLFDPYTGADVGDAEPRVTQLFEQVSTLHKDFFTGRRGRALNGIGGLCITVLCLTGSVIWWPGLGGLRRAMTIRFGQNWKRVNWDLHNALGFWCVLVIFMWAVTGVYLVFPSPFQALVDLLQPAEEAGVVRTGDAVLAWITSLHFGRSWGLGVEIGFGLLGLVPPVLFVTGTVMWWNRKL